jgi:hypothetical protein
MIAEIILERELLGRPIPLLNDGDFVDVVSLGGQINI